MKTYLLLLFFTLSFIETLLGQPYHFRHYKVEEGLSYNTVLSSLQDQEGFMWFGTKSGLNRFDGYNFKVFYKKANDSTSLGSDFVPVLYESHGKLWIGTDNGIYSYNRETEDFSLLKVTSNNTIRAITDDNNGNLWFIAENVLSKYSLENKILQTYNSKSLNATALCNTPNGGIWVATASGHLHKYDASTDSFLGFDLFTHSDPVPSTILEKIRYGGDCKILATSKFQGLKVFDTITEKYVDLIPFDNDSSELYVRDVIRRNDEYWIATESGLFIHSINTGKVLNLKKSYNDPYAISDNALYSLCEDKEGGVWLGTYFGGLNYYHNQHTTFEKFFPKTGENSIGGNAVREITQDHENNFWIGTEDGGLNKLNSKSGKITNFMPHSGKNGLSHYNIHGLLALGNEVWVGTFEHGIDVLDIRTNKVIRHYSTYDSSFMLKSNFIYSIIESKTGVPYFGSTMGLYKYDSLDDSFALIDEFPENHFYTKLLEDKKGTLWAGTSWEGLYYYNAFTKKKGFFKHEQANEKSLSNNSVNGIFEDSEGGLWIMTEDGLNKYESEDRSFGRYSMEDGFPSNVFYSMLEDKGKNLWISTAKGLVKFTPKTGKIITYTKDHGLLGDQFNYGTAFKDASGRMYFGSVNGMISFNPAEIVSHDFIPPVHITGFQINNKEMLANKEGSPLKKSLAYTDNITLSHEQSSFSLDFAALSYTAPEMTQYAYKMKGIDHQWIYLKTNRKVYFTDLKPGSYTFMVKAANHNGIWSKKPSVLNITISPPWWASPLSYFLYAISAALLIFYGVRSYHQQIHIKNKRKIQLWENEKEKEVYNAKIEFFTNVAHEIRTPLTLIKGPLEKVIKISGDVPHLKENLTIMEKNTSRLLALTNQLLDFRKTEINGFSLTFVRSNISQLMLETFTRFKIAAEEKNLQFDLELPKTPLQACIDPEAFTKILSNLFNNAINYGKSIVKISLLPLDEQHKEIFFSIVVKNDGAVIPLEMVEKVFEPFFRMEETKDKTGTGIGLPLARSLTELHKGTLHIDTTVANLNVFILRLPLLQEKKFNLFTNETKEVISTEPFPEEKNIQAKPKILVVEDNKEMSDFISSDLCNSYTVLRAYDGERALDILKNNHIKLIISDIMMPLMNGYELCQKVKTNLDHSHIPIILLTAKNSFKAKIEGLESGADAYIEKPFSPEHLVVQVANLLTNRRKVTEHYSNTPLANLKSMANSEADEAFLEKLNEGIDKYIGDSYLNVDQLAEFMNMSKPTLYRKIKAISNLTPNELINLARLKKAAELLNKGTYRIYEVATMVGYNSTTNFGRNFLKQFGMTPSEYTNNKEKVLGV